MADAYFPAREEPPAAPTVLSRETRATLSSAEQHKQPQLNHSSWKIGRLPPPTLRDWRGPDGWRATAAPPSEQSLHGGASQQRALPPSCVQTGNALIADCTVLWICMQTDTAKYISGCSRRATLSPRCSARPGQICCSNTVFFNKYIQTEIKAPLPNPQARRLANRRGRAILIFPSPQCWGIALQLFWSFSITLLRWR